MCGFKACPKYAPYNLSTFMDVTAKRFGKLHHFGVLLSMHAREMTVELCMSRLLCGLDVGTYIFK